MLEFLKGEEYDADSTACEYRFVTSGVLAAGDPRTATGRMLLDSPFEWVVASDQWKRVPMDEWPQESVVRFQVNDVVGSAGKRIYFYSPDDELAHDLAALLSLLTRRLVTAVGCISQRAFQNGPGKPAVELPFPLLCQMNLRHWPAQPTLVIRKPEEPEATAINYNPHPKRIDRDALRFMLTGLPQLPAARSIVLAARLYASALSLLHQEPDIAYLLLTMAIETAASQAVNASRTDEEILRGIPEGFRTIMASLGASAEQVRLASAAVVPVHGRPTYQFRAFATDFHTDELFSPDDLFRTQSIASWLPDKAGVKTAAEAIYKQRSKFVHEGMPYPASIALALSAKVDRRAFHIDLAKGPPIPPLPWVERLAQNCIVNFWRQGVIGLSTDSPASPAPAPAPRTTP